MRAFAGLSDVALCSEISCISNGSLHVKSGLKFGSNCVGTKVPMQFLLYRLPTPFINLSTEAERVKTNLETPIPSSTAEGRQKADVKRADQKKSDRYKSTWPSSC